MIELSPATGLPLEQPAVAERVGKLIYEAAVQPSHRPLFVLASTSMLARHVQEAINREREVLGSAGSPFAVDHVWIDQMDRTLQLHGEEMRQLLKEPTHPLPAHPQPDARAVVEELVRLVRGMECEQDNCAVPVCVEVRAALARAREFLEKTK